MEILDLLASDNFIPLNRVLAKTIGLNEAILFGALCGYQKHFKGEEFYREQEKIIEDTCLTEYLVRNATKRLLELELITLTKKGLPAKYYYKINENGVLRLLTSSGAKFDTTSSCSFDTTLNNNNLIKEKKDKKDYKNEILTVVSYLNGKAGTSYKTSTPKTITLITARLNEGFTTQDFIAIIDKKVEEWKNSDMERYLRPETLFGTKFEGYLNAKGKQKSAEMDFGAKYGVRL